MMAKEKINLTILLLTSLVLSIILYFRTYVISVDGADQYIPLAKEFVSGLFGKALSHDQQPLYSLLVAVASQWVPDFEVAGKLVSTLFGILLIFPVYFLGKRIFDEKIAFLSSILLVVHPYLRRFSADVLKESTYLFFFATALWFAWKAIQEEKKYAFFFIPLCSVIAYLVRPDGVEVLIIAFFYILLIKQFSIPKRKRTVILLLILSSVLLLLPYLVCLREIRGAWTFSKAKSLGWMLGLEIVGDEVPFTQKIFYSLKRLNSEIPPLFTPSYIFLLAIGLMKRIFSPRKTGEGFLLSFGLFHLVVLFLMVLNTTQWGAEKTVSAEHLSGRHGLPLLLISIFWVGQGFMAIHQWISKKIGSHSLMQRIDSKKRPSIIFIVLLVLFLAIVLPKTLKSQRYERLPEKWAGIWIRNQSGQGATIYTTVPRVAYYAEGSYQYVDFKKTRIEEIKRLMEEKKGFYLVIQEKEASFLSSEDQWIVEVKRLEGKGLKTIIVYQKIR